MGDLNYFLQTSRFPICSMDKIAGIECDCTWVLWPITQAQLLAISDPQVHLRQQCWLVFPRQAAASGAPSPHRPIWKPRQGRGSEKHLTPFFSCCYWSTWLLLQCSWISAWSLVIVIGPHSMFHIPCLICPPFLHCFNWFSWLCFFPHPIWLSWLKLSKLQMSSLLNQNQRQEEWLMLAKSMNWCSACFPRQHVNWLSIIMNNWR